jgi:hypothetical protein
MIECPICYKELSTYIALDCEHKFCISCIYRWYETNNTCPSCRGEFTLHTIGRNRGYKRFKRRIHNMQEEISELHDCIDQMESLLDGAGIIIAYLENRLFR